jgi:hypothetical protein
MSRRRTALSEVDASKVVAFTVEGGRHSSSGIPLRSLTDKELSLVRQRIASRVGLRDSDHSVIQAIAAEYRRRGHGHSTLCPGTSSPWILAGPENGSCKHSH